MVQSHIPFPRANALFVAMVEFACVAALALGLLTPMCAAMLMGDLIVALAIQEILVSASGSASPVEPPTQIADIERQPARGTAIFQ